MPFRKDFGSHANHDPALSRQHGYQRAVGLASIPTCPISWQLRPQLGQTSSWKGPAAAGTQSLATDPGPGPCRPLLPWFAFWYLLVVALVRDVEPRPSANPPALIPPLCWLLSAHRLLALSHP